MLKRLSLLKAGIIVFAAAAVFTFQNCSQKSEDPELLNQLAIAPEIDQEHDDEDHDLPTPPAESLEEIKSMMDRNLLVSMFSDIFGPEVHRFSSIKRIKAEKAIFGGPCSVYDQFNSVRAGNKIDAAATPCAHLQSSNSLMAPIDPAANVLQQALINNACNDSVDNATSFAYIVKQIKEDPAVTIPANSSENAAKLFSLFYRGKPVPPVEVSDAIQLLVGQPASLAGWKSAILNICLSSHWQAL
jgi:hypothetical protein